MKLIEYDDDEEEEKTKWRKRDENIFVSMVIIIIT